MFRGLFCGCCEQSLTQHEESMKGRPAPSVGLTEEFLKTSDDEHHQHHDYTLVPPAEAGVGATYLDATNKPQTVPQSLTQRRTQDDNAKVGEDGAAASARSVTSRASSLTPEEKEKEKLRLQRLVKDFAKDAVGGADVVILSPTTHEKTPRVMFMDRYLSKLRLKDTHDGDNTVEYNMRDIGVIFKGVDVTKRCADLPIDLATNCVGFESGGDTSSSSFVLFHFSDSYSRDKFYTCLKILRMSVELNQGQPAGGQQK